LLIPNILPKNRGEGVPLNKVVKSRCQPEALPRIFFVEEYQRQAGSPKPEAGSRKPKAET
jgi:hypothetical protein